MRAFADGSTRNFSYDTTDDVLTRSHVDTAGRYADTDAPTPTRRRRRPGPHLQHRRPHHDVPERHSRCCRRRRVRARPPTRDSSTSTALVCGDNVFEFRVENTVPNSGYTLPRPARGRWAISVDRSCGKAGSPGCDDDNHTQGVVADDADVLSACRADRAPPAPAPALPRCRSRDAAASRSTAAWRATTTSRARAAAPPDPSRCSASRPRLTGCYEFATCGTSFDSQLSLGDGSVRGDRPVSKQFCVDDNQSLRRRPRTSDVLRAPATPGSR